MNITIAYIAFLIYRNRRFQKGHVQAIYPTYIGIYIYFITGIKNIKYLTESTGSNCN